MDKNRLNILLVDNDEDEYILTRNLLSDIEGFEFKLDWIATYEEALETIVLNQHDVCLIDYRLGQQSGIDLLREAMARDCQAPLILLTGYGSHEVDLEAMRAGAADYLVKGQVDAPLLERSIRYAVEQKRMEEVLRQAHDELETWFDERTTELSKANELLKEEIAERQRLEKRVQDSLRRRARQVQTVTEVAQEIAATPNLDVLFRQVVNLVQERFGYYHAHVYTLEDGDLVMQEGTGDAGRKIKESGHKIPLAAKRSLVARAAQTGEPILVPNVYQEQRWLPNPLLPETKSELAAPIKLGSVVLGVLDVQNDKVGSLDEEDQILMMGLCGQIAIAINNRRLEARRQEAEEAQRKLVEELDAFAYTVGHNLRDTLALIIGYADLLKEEARLPDELQEYLNAIARNGRKMTTVIEELELLAGVRKAKVELKPLNMPRIIAEVRQRLAYLIEEYQAEITVSEYWPVAYGHKPWVEEVWANYLSNALKYSGRPPRIQLGATERSDGMIRFWVRDNGPGLTKEEQAQLFTEFTRLSQNRAGGYGLGLSIVRRIVNKFGGEIGCESEVGQGSVFYFTLPSVAKAQES
ncbi:MAG: GAF domain-containing protein [Anaerolineae bacterium]|nr:GAF domain-containing protein [Anaerolineae bacterium]